MNLENQVVSLELANKLKDLGVKQNAYFCWFNLLGSEYEYAISESWQIDDPEKFDEISAFTVAELGNMLPGMITTQDDLYLTMDCNKCPYYETMNSSTELYANDSADNDSEADARAKMLIYLLENTTSVLNMNV